MNKAALSSAALYRKIRKDFIGLDTAYILATGEKSRRIYLDSSASTLMMRTAHDVIERFYSHYANTHSLLHFGAKIATREYAWAHDRILSFAGASPDNYTCFFTGSGTTAGINRMARVFRDIRPDRDTAVVSIMEHHSNDLPHRKHMKKILHVPVEESPGGMGCLSLEALERILKENEGQINYVALTGVSNVTGIINPIHEAAELAHTYGALILVDGAQLLAHTPVAMEIPGKPSQNIDALVFSGHKIYVPGSPGVVIARRDLLSETEPEEVGGGMVEHVFVDRYEVKETFPDREEAGTPNISGAIGLAAAVDVLDRIGMELLRNEEDKIICEVLEKMGQIPDVSIYGEPDPDLCARVASVSFNVKGLDHGLVAAILNDYFNISVRNHCFCAHPYVKEMIMEDLLEMADETALEDMDKVFHRKRGMVRASFAIYSTAEDVVTLIEAVEDISRRKDYYRSLYHAGDHDDYVHNTFHFDHRVDFSIEDCVSELTT
ncbi:MAG: aminotransferase class V-fold PLP-dependent enzyme [Candidatus Neomarinimicrobiota bacterium]